MLTVLVDRDSVAMGDDVEGHLVQWQFEDDATLGELLVRIVEGGFLARVAGSVAWSLRAGGLEVRTLPDGSRCLQRGDGPTATLAVLLLPLGGEPQVSVLWYSGLGQSLDDLMLAGNGGQLSFYVHYASGGSLQAWSTVRGSWGRGR